MNRSCEDEVVKIQRMSSLFRRQIDSFLSNLKEIEE